MYPNPVELLPDVVPKVTKCVPLCGGMPPRTLHLWQALYQTYAPLLQNAARRYNSIPKQEKTFLVLKKYSRLVAFCSRGVYIWYNVCYKCQILPKVFWPGRETLWVTFLGFYRANGNGPKT